MTISNPEGNRAGCHSQWECASGNQYHDKNRSSANQDGFSIRREAVEHGIPLFTSLDTANAILKV